MQSIVKVYCNINHM